MVKIFKNNFFRFLDGKWDRGGEERGEQAGEANHRFEGEKFLIDLLLTIVIFIRFYNLLKY